MYGCGFSCQSMMHSNAVVGITIFGGSFVFSQSRVKVFGSLTNAKCGRRI